MKYLLLVLLLSGCGEMKELSSRITSVEDDVNSIKQQIALLEQGLAVQVSTIESLESLVDSLTNSNAASISILQANILVLQANAVNTTAQLAVLNGYQHIIGFVNPCGDNPNRYDEVFFKVYNASTNSYSLIASFSDNVNGLNTRFSVIAPGGPYMTTDGDNCQFRVAADGFTITNQNHMF